MSDTQEDPRGGRGFEPETLTSSAIAVPLLRAIAERPDELHRVIIDINLRYAGGRMAARGRVFELIASLLGGAGGKTAGEELSLAKSEASRQYVYARLRGETIRRLVELDRAGSARAIYHVWPDFVVRAQIWQSAATVKADACRRAFATSGKGIVWALLDSGVDAAHPHFARHANLTALPAPLGHMDFTVNPPQPVAVCTDPSGHGTHVAGIIAGELVAGSATPPVVIGSERDAQGNTAYTVDNALSAVAGIAPECKLVSYRVLDESGEGSVSDVIAAIEFVQEINGHGREIVIHGVNLSLGYEFDAEWFACGQSPLCVEVNRLVKSGVVVVAAAGNTGHGRAVSINDPGNAELAITVGSTHRDMPHAYGVSYFSAKGPTGDGRRKPDLLAPGERIMSCGAGTELARFQKRAGIAAAAGAYYIERSGTSMAAPHLSGMIAGLLSVRREFIGRPEEIKAMFVNNTTDLGRERSFQGTGLADMMRTIQAV
jgi:serine protease AprX